MSNCYNTIHPELVDQIQKTFTQLMPKHRLLAAKLDGFSHTIYYDKGSKDDDVKAASYSAYSPEQKFEVIAAQVFKNIPHYNYQGNPATFIWIDPEDR